MLDPEQVAKQLDSYESVLRTSPEAREITTGMPLIKDQKKSLLEEAERQGLTATLQSGKWQVTRKQTEINAAWYERDVERRWDDQVYNDNYWG